MQVDKAGAYRLTVTPRDTDSWMPPNVSLEYEFQVEVSATRGTAERMNDQFGMCVIVSARFRTEQAERGPLRLQAEWADGRVLPVRLGSALPAIKLSVYHGNEPAEFPQQLLKQLTLLVRSLIG
jgi:hypothetical protein